MSLHIRLLLLLIVCTSAFAVGATLWKRHEAEEIVMMQQDARRERAEFTGQILTLKESGLATLVRDYTFWDEMARFAQKGGRTWAVQNIDTALPTYKATGAWVYNLKGRLVYSTNLQNDTKLKSLPIPLSDFLPRLHKERFTHFFMRHPAGLLEVRGATIHTTTDTHRTGRVFGYFFAARLWDKAYLKEVEELTASHVKLLPPTRNANAVSLPEFTTRIEQTLSGWDGHPLALLCLTSQHTTLRLLARSQKAAAKQAFTYVLALIGLLWVCLLCWVSLPLRRVTYALQTETPERLGNLPRTHGDFGHLARLVNSFFH